MDSENVADHQLLATFPRLRHDTLCFRHGLCLWFFNEHMSPGRESRLCVGTVGIGIG